MPAIKGLLFQHRVTPSLLTLLYVEQQQDMPWIAQHLGCSTSTVNYYMRKFGIARRPKHWHVTGERSPLKGKHHSEYTKRLICDSLKGKVPVVNQRPMSIVHREAIRQAALRDRFGDRLPHRKGSEHWNWKGGIHVYNERERQQSKLKTWRIAVYYRDAFTCQVCTQVGGKLNAHHIEMWSKNKKRRFDIDNGITLCVRCHVDLHKQERRVT